MAQPAPKDKDFVAMGNPRWRPTALDDRDPLDWLGGKDVCRQILKDLCTRELEALRKRERHLRITYEEPARDGAELRRQVLASSEGSLLLRHERAHTLTYNRAYDSLLKGRLQSLKTGRPPGAPGRAEDDGAEQHTAGNKPEPDATSVAEARAQRKREAKAVAPGPDNGIGAAGGPGRRDDRDGKKGEAEDVRGGRRDVPSHFRGRFDGGRDDVTEAHQPERKRGRIPSAAAHATQPSLARRVSVPRKT